MSIIYKTEIIPYFVDGDFSCKLSYLFSIYDRLECCTVFDGDIDWTICDYLKSHNYIRLNYDTFDITPAGREFFEGLLK